MSSSFTPPHTHSPPPSSALPCIPSFLSSTPHSFSRAPSNSLMLSFPLFIFHYFYEFSRGIGSLLLHLCIAVSSQLSLCFPIYLTSPFLQFHLVLYLPLSLSDHALSAARFNHDGHSHSLSFSLFLFNITVLAPYLFFRYLWCHEGGCGAGEYKRICFPHLTIRHTPFHSCLRTHAFLFCHSGVVQLSPNILLEATSLFPCLSPSQSLLAVCMMLFDVIRNDSNNKKWSLLA